MKFMPAKDLVLVKRLHVPEAWAEDTAFEAAIWAVNPGVYEKGEIVLVRAYAGTEVTLAGVDGPVGHKYLIIHEDDILGKFLL